MTARLVAMGCSLHLAGCSAHFVESPSPLDSEAIRDAQRLAQVRALGRDGD